MTEELVSRTGRLRQRYDGKYRLVAGCIPYRHKESAEACSDTVNQELEVLMVSSHSSPTKLLFPKGGWEIDESAQEAACRETLEEAGVRGIIKKDLGSWDFRSKEYQDDGDEGFHRAHVFALLVTEQLDSWPEQNERQREWVTITEADRRCKHDWMRQALHSCATYLSSRQNMESFRNQYLRTVLSGGCSGKLIISCLPQLQEFSASPCAESSFFLCLR